MWFSEFVIELQSRSWPHPATRSGPLSFRLYSTPRSQKVRPSAHEDGAAHEQAAEHAEQPEARLVARERAATVRAAFERLEPRDRELLELRVIGGLDATAVAQIVGKRPGAVRMAQERALSNLGAMLGEGDP